MDQDSKNEPVSKDIDLSLTKAGRFLVYSLWIQSQLSDLVILNKNKEIINDFNTKPVIPEILLKERFVFWERDFKEVKEIFEKELSELLDEQAKKDLNTIYYLRNAISHSQVSVGRKYLFYKPKNEKILISIRKLLNITNKDEPGLIKDIIKLDFSNDQNNMVLIKRFDEVSIDEICKKIGVLHARIR